MTTQISRFQKTEHFLLRQWDRGIEDSVLHAICPLVKGVKNKKEVVFVLPSFLKKQGVMNQTSQCLILIVKGHLLISGYWRDLNECLFGQKVFHNPLILN
jgi:hypothetical protein